MFKMRRFCVRKIFCRKSLLTKKKIKNKIQIIIYNIIICILFWQYREGCYVI